MSGISPNGPGHFGDPEGLALARHTMVDEQIALRGVRDSRVLAAMRRLPRHAFVPADLVREAYEDRPLPVGHGQTISQPYVVAAMTELAHVHEKARVLEIGTGSGYQTAVLAELAAQVYSIEIIPELAERARQVLAMLGHDNISLRVGDGYAGWPEVAPFDAIVVTAAPPAIPRPLADQLAEHGHLVIPIGVVHQELLVLRKEHNRLTEASMFPVRFVPMVGQAQHEE